MVPENQKDEGDSAFSDVVQPCMQLPRNGKYRYTEQEYLRHLLFADNTWLVAHTSILKHIGPFAGHATMAVLEMLAEVVCTEELFGLIAFPKFVLVVQMLAPDLPVRGVWKFFSAIATHVGEVRALG